MGPLRVVLCYAFDDILLTLPQIIQLTNINSNMYIKSCISLVNMCIVMKNNNLNITSLLWFHPHSIQKLDLWYRIAFVKWPSTIMQTSRSFFSYFLWKNLYGYKMYISRTKIGCIVCHHIGKSYLIPVFL